MFCPYCSHSCDAGDRFCSHCGAPLYEDPQRKKGRHWVPILAMVLVFSFGLFLFFALPGTDNANSDTPWFQLDDGVLSFDADLYGGDSELRIPESIDGATVTALAEGCFKNCTNLTSVILPPTLQAIGEDAFKGCTALRGIEIPESVLFMGENAFSGCSALEAVCIYDGIRTIGAGSFSGCAKLFYIYYSGNFEDWDNLYGEFVNPYTTVFAQDGAFYQGEAPKK